VKRGGILLIIVLVLAGGVGWYVWDQNKKDNSVASSNSSISQTATSQNGSDYLAIKEWGVRFKLPENLKGDIDYKYDSTSNVVRFGSKKFSTIQPYCSSDSIGVGILLRTQDQSKIPNYSRVMKTINGYTYYVTSDYVLSNGSCNKNSMFSTSQLKGESALEQELLDSMKSLTIT
jgi:hypothetical protein